jgi:predicted dehydrogenase
MRWAKTSSVNRSASNDSGCARRTSCAPTIAVIGCGLIAERYHLPALAKNRSAIDRAILVDLDATRTARLAAQFGISRVAEDVASVINEIDAAIVAVPPALHYPICMELLSRGVHVLCEKPLADSAEKGADMVCQAARHGAILCVNHTRRLYPAYATIRRLVDDGALGALSALRYEEGYEFNWPAASAFHFRSGARGVLLDTGIHALDILCWGLGEKPDLVSSENDSFGGPEALARVQLQNGPCRAELKLSWLTRLANRFEIVGERGTIAGRIDVWDRVVIEHHDGRREQIRLRVPERNYDDFGTAMLQNFLDAIAGRAEPLVPGSTVLPALELMDEAYQAARQLPLPWLEPQMERCYG